MANSLESPPPDASRPQQAIHTSAGNAAEPSSTAINRWAATLELFKQMWRRRPGLMALMDNARKFALNTAVIFTVALAFFLIIKGAFFRGSIGSIMINPISAPKELAERGYTGDVIAQRIRDEISEIYQKARTTLDDEKKEPSDFTTIPFEQTMPRLEMPGGSMSLAAVVTGVRDLLGLIDKKITGEVITDNPLAHAAESPDSKQTKYLMRLRTIDHDAISHSPEPTEKLDELFQSVALHVIEQFEPVVAAHYYHFKRDWHNASRMVTAALKNNREDDDLAALNLRGQIAASQGLSDEALDEFRHVLELYPNARTQQLLASVLLQTGKNQEAFEAAQASINLAPRARSALAYNLAGVALIRLKQYDEALNFLRTSNEIDSKFALAYYNQGIVFRDRKPPDNDKAIAMFMKATDANPDNALAYRAWGSLLKKLGNQEKAKSVYLKWIAADSKSPISYDLLGDLYLEERDWQKAADMFQKAQQAAPRWVKPRYDLGRAMRVAGRFDEAIAIFQDVLIMFQDVLIQDPQLRGSAYSQWGLSLALKAEQKQDESEASLDLAEEKLKKALQISPPQDNQVRQDVEEARAIIEKIHAKSSERPKVD